MLRLSKVFFKKTNFSGRYPEYLGAGSLEDLIKRTTAAFTEQEIATVLRMVVLGLDGLHKRNLIHRDIRALNILLNDQGESKIADFGITAKLEEKIQQCRTVIGSPLWMAPEVFMGEYDTKIDIWSLGITAFEMAVGQPPHADVNPSRVIFVIAKSPSPTLPNPEQWSQEFHDFLAGLSRVSTLDMTCLLCSVFK